MYLCGTDTMGHIQLKPNQMIRIIINNIMNNNNIVIIILIHLCQLNKCLETPALPAECQSINISNFVKKLINTLFIYIDAYFFLQRRKAINCDLASMVLLPGSESLIH